MDDIQHHTIDADGARLHVATLGAGPPLLLLHGWPEYWLTWEPVMRRLAGSYQLIAPDLRGFGLSAAPRTEPSTRVGPDVHAADVLAALDALGVGTCGLVAHDVGAYVGQVLGRTAADRFAKLFFFDCPYPGIGGRWAEPEKLREIWYQSFNQQPFAAALVGATRDSCRAYIGHFLRHWAGRPDAFNDVMDAFTDTFTRPGVLQGGFNWYLSSAAARLATISGTLPPEPPITVPTRVRWGARSPLMPYEWSDRLGETFADLDLAPIACGHFPHREDPDAAAAAIDDWFSRGRAS